MDNLRKLLLLDGLYSSDSNDIKRIANEQGWSTERTSKYSCEQTVKDFDVIRYYGNTLLWANIKDEMPFWIPEIPDEILPKLNYFTKRYMEMMTFGEMIERRIPKRSFIKPCGEKWFEAKVYEPGEVIIGSQHDYDNVYVSEVKDFIHEVRCFVVGGEVLTSSLYRIAGKIWSTTDLDPKDINFDEKIKNTPLETYCRLIYRVGLGLPNSLVMDFGMEQDGTWSLIEFNNPPFCGLYYTNYEKAFEVILSAQRNRRLRII